MNPNPYDYNPFLRNMFVNTDTFKTWSFTPNEEYIKPDPNAPFVSSNRPRNDHIDGGVILKSGLTITRLEFA